jgi:hypothetical protein
MGRAKRNPSRWLRASIDGFRFALPVLRNDEVAQSVRPIGTTGKSLENLSISSRKNIPLASSGKSAAESARLAANEGRFAIVTNVR